MFGLESHWLWCFLMRVPQAPLVPLNESTSHQVSAAPSALSCSFRKRGTCDHLSLGKTSILEICRYHSTENHGVWGKKGREEGVGCVCSSFVGRRRYLFTWKVQSASKRFLSFLNFKDSLAMVELQLLSHTRRSGVLGSSQVECSM